MFPSVLNTFARPSPTDRLNNPSHSALHNTVSSALGQVEATIGVRGDSSVVGTINTTIFSPGSDGGGHVQSANKGGTGQTNFTKGDLLVAQSASVLTKLAVSSTLGEVLTSDPAQATGIKWSPTALNKVFINRNSTTVSGNTEQTLFAASILGSVLGTNNAIRFAGAISPMGYQDNFTIGLIYGNNTIASTTVTNISPGSVLSGEVTGYVVASNSSIAQQGYFNLNTISNRAAQLGQIVHVFGYGTSSVNSMAPQELRITMTYAGTNPLSSVTGVMFVVDKIQ